MKFLLLALTLTLVAAAQAQLTDEQREKIKVTHNECVEETKIDPEIPKKMRQGIFENEDQLKQYVFCANKKLGIQNEAGEFQADVIRKGANNEEKANKLIENCMKTKGTPEDSALEWAKCLHNNKD